MSISLGFRSEGIGDGRSWMGIEGRTKYQPVGLPVSPNLLWEVTTKRTLGSSGMITGVQLTAFLDVKYVL